MRILFIGLASHFTNGMTYQDNMLLKACSINNEVFYIGDVYEFENGKLVEGKEREYMIDSSVHMFRVKYDRIVNDFVSAKIQKVSKLKTIVEKIKPDIIFFHGIGGRELLTIKHYIKKNPNVIWYADSHADFHNTAKTPLAKFLYKVVHGFFIRSSFRYINKIFYITYECKEYLKEMYHIPEDKLEWYPLGGVVFDDSVYNSRREKIRKLMNLSDEDILFVHSGKMDKGKKTKELLEAFFGVKDPRFRLVLVGRFSEDVQAEVMPIVTADERVSYAGWKSGEELMDYLCAADVYAQPGTQSATMQNAVCCRCAMMLYPYSSHKQLINDNGFYVKDVYEIQKALEQISNEPQKVKMMSKASEKIGKEVLDYRILAERICK